MLICPHCQSPLTKFDNSLKCINNHSFDLSKEGYVNLLVKNSINHGDNKAMVNARTNFLNKGYYLVMLKKIIEIIKNVPHHTILDLGCGEGYYTNKIQQIFRESEILGIDISKEAIKHAAKTNKETTYLIASNASLPIDEKSIDVALCLFSFVDYNEVKRVLKKDGILIVVSPNIYHLFELKEKIYETPYINTIEVPKQNALTLKETFDVTYNITLDNNQNIKELFMMTPYAFKTSESDTLKLDKLDILDTRVSFILTLYQNND